MTDNTSQTTRILIVEDNDFVRMQIVKFIEDAGYQTTESANGEDALKKVDDTITLAIVDVRMEPLGGFDFIRSLIGQGIELPVILVTGDKDPELLSDSAKLKVAAVLMKPVQKERLIKTVERTLKMKERTT